MGLFGQDQDDDETQEVDPPQADEASPAETAPPEDEASAPDDLEEAKTEEPSSETQTPAEDTGDDLDVEDALKELSARMAVLSSNLEGVQESRGELEDKLGTVEQRMSRLGSLAEAVSSEYNPFISENAPDEPSWTPELEAAEDRDPVPPSDPSSGDDEADPGSPDPTTEAPDEGAAPAPDETPTDGDQPGANGAPAEAPPHVEPSEPEPPDDAEEDPLEMPRTDPSRLEPSPDPAHEDPGTEPAHAADEARSLTHLDPHAPEDGLEENLLMLEWVGMMLDRVGRAGLMDLLDYYQNLGWLDPTLKEHATRVAIGVEAPDRVGEGHWRGEVDLHRRSLVAIQRLQGNDVPAARIDELQLDLQRLFEG